MKLDDLKAEAQAIDALSEGGKKYRLAGKMVQDPQSQYMNTLKISSWLPTPRLVAWVRAFKQANSEVLSRMSADAKVALKAIPPEGLGRNGTNFLKHDLGLLVRLCWRAPHLREGWLVLGGSAL